MRSCLYPFSQLIFLVSPNLFSLGLYMLCFLHQERDETIQDKEKRIYDLKKKNQELEKFKFVLDYKIKELKKQVIERK